MARLSQHPSFVNLAVLQEAGLTGEMIASGIAYVHNILDGLDSQLLSAGAFRLSQMFELANVSSMLGNLLGAGIANASSGAFLRNGPHRYILTCWHKSLTQAMLKLKFLWKRTNPKGI